MSSPFEIARAHQAARTRLADQATRRALLWWRRINPQELDAGWDSFGKRLVDEAVAAQIDAARQANDYIATIAAQAEAPTGPRVVPQAFGGVQLDGRELGPALFGAVTTTKRATSTVGASRAFEIGTAYLATVLGTAIQDMGRQADMVGAAGRKWTRYVRVLSPGACSRCAVLAGKGSAAVAFKRHPRCRCTAYPLPQVAGKDGGKIPPGFFDNPSAYFESLSPAEQRRVFTDAGAAAINSGADISKVVNARRGAYGIGYSGGYNIPVSTTRGALKPVTIGRRPDGSPLTVYATTEGTTARGEFGRNELRLGAEAVRDGRYRRTTSLRLMPEQIALMAGDDPDRFVELLRRYGYLN